MSANKPELSISHSGHQSSGTNAIATNCTGETTLSIAAPPSGTASEVVSGWEDLPNELLIRIVTHLQLCEQWRKEYQVEKACLLAMRLVHPRWKLVVDELLEKWCLEYWTKCKPAYSSNPYRFPQVCFEINRDGLRNENMLFPTYLDEERSSSPTKSVCFSERRENQLWKCVDDFSKYGSHLTSLTFHCSNSPLTLKTLANVLHWTPNVKVIEVHVERIQIEAGGFELKRILLPSLEQLEHARLWGFNYPPCTLNWHGWLLKPYKTQLLTLDIDDTFRWNQNEGCLAFDNVKRLRVSHPTTQLLKSEIVFPSLQCLSLSLGCTGVSLKGRHLDMSNDAGATLPLVPNFISQSSSKLVELHIDLEIYDARPLRFRKKIAGSEEAAGSAISNNFPLLKLFGTFYPISSGEEEALKDFFSMFPNLEDLRLTVGGKTDGECERNHLKEQQYWRFCPKLRIISAVMVGPERQPLFTIQAPFPPF